MTSNENENIKKSVSELHGAARAAYIWDYYKLHILLSVFVIIIVISFIMGRINKKESVLNVVMVNISVNDELKTRLCDEYIAFLGADPQKSEVVLITGLYMSDEPNDLSSAYTSTMKLMAMIEAKQADVIIADNTAIKIIADNGYLTDPDDISRLNISDMGYTDSVYAGIVANTPRPNDARGYIEYLKNK